MAWSLLVCQGGWFLSGQIGVAHLLAMDYALSAIYKGCRGLNDRECRK